MSQRRRPVLVLLSAVLMLSSLSVAPALAQTGEPAEPSTQVLVFSKTAGFRHDSIPDGIQAIEDLGAEHGFGVTATEDAAEFTVDNLAQYDAVVWLSTTGDVLNAEQQTAFEQYIQDGGGYAGVHAAADTEYDWGWYGDLVGAYFDSHPQNQTATVAVGDRVHPSTSHLPVEWERFDEWYNYQTNPSGDVHVLARLQEDTYDAGDGAMGWDHPIAWCQNYDGGRSWYTGMGHTSESFTEDEAFTDHLLGGIQWAAGLARADCDATTDDAYEQTKLTGPTHRGSWTSTARSTGWRSVTTARCSTSARPRAGRSSPTGATPTSGWARARSTSGTPRRRRSPSPRPSTSSATAVVAGS